MNDYAFVEGWGNPQAILVLDEPLTKLDIIKHGWAGYAVRVLTDPTTANFESPYVYGNEIEAERDVKAHRALKYGRWYYRLGPADHHSSKFEDPYWKEGKTNDYTLDLLMSALNAPTLNIPRSPYRYHMVTPIGERVDMTVWDYALKDGRHYDGADYGSVIERSKLPGIGFSFVPDKYVFDDPKNVDDWPNSLPYLKESGALSPTVVINFPNSELGPNTCVRFKLEVELEKVPYAAPNGGVGFNYRYTSCYLSFVDFLFPEKIRRIKLPRFQPRTATNTVSCYVLNRQEEKKFVEKLSSKTISDQVKSFLYGDGSGATLSLKWFFGIRPNISTAQKTKITLGNFIIDDLTVPVYAGDFTQVYMGKVFVRGPFQDYRDYTNARYQMYIPLIGHIDLEASQVVGKNVHLLFTVNLTDGSAVATVATTDNGENLSKKDDWYETTNNIFTTSFTYGYNIPLNVEATKDTVSRTGEIVAKSVAAGAAGAIAGNAVGAALGVAAAVASSSPTTASYSSGSQTENSNVMGDFTPKIYVKFNKDRGGDFSSVVGYPCGKLVKVGEASGYLKAAMVYGTPSTTMQHTDEIINMLKEGIYIS